MRTFTCILFIAVGFLLSTCKKENKGTNGTVLIKKQVAKMLKDSIGTNSTLPGTWKLTATLSDPGVMETARGCR